MRHDPNDEDWIGRDRFVLSCGHSSLTLYIQLYLSGYGLELDDLKALRTFGSKTPGHPEHRHTPGIEITTGPLGQGVASAVGMAMAARRERGLFDPDAAPGQSPFDHARRPVPPWSANTPMIVSDPETAPRHPADCRTAVLDLLDAHMAVGRVGRAVGPEHPTAPPAPVNRHAARPAGNDPAPVTTLRQGVGSVSMASPPEYGPGHGPQAAESPRCARSWVGWSATTSAAGCWRRRTCRICATSTTGLARARRSTVPAIKSAGFRDQPRRAGQRAQHHHP
jgi:hypothetical protein